MTRSRGHLLDDWAVADEVAEKVVFAQASPTPLDLDRRFVSGTRSSGVDWVWCLPLSRARGTGDRLSGRMIIEGQVSGNSRRAICVATFEVAMDPVIGSVSENPSANSWYGHGDAGECRTHVGLDWVGTYVRAG